LETLCDALDIGVVAVLESGVDCVLEGTTVDDSDATTVAGLAEEVWMTEDAEEMGVNDVLVAI
jgi:hypothetical protein